MSVDSWKSVFDFIAVVAILLSFLAGGGALITGRIINERQAKQLREFDKNLSDEKTELVKQETLVETLRGDNLRLQKEILLMGPRENLLSGEKRRVFVDSLRRFSGQRIDIRRSAFIGSIGGVSIGASVADEASGLARSLIGAMKDAGWSLPDAMLGSPSSQEHGISVQILRDASPKTRGAVKALVKSLDAVPLIASASVLMSDDLAKRSESETTPLPLFDKDTIVLVVHQK